MLNPGDAIYYFEIKIDFLKDNVVTEEKEHRILGINDELLVLDNCSFTRLQHKGDRFYVNEPFKIARVSKWCTKPYWDDIRGHIYTDNNSKKAAHDAIRKALKDYIYENYGRYCKGIDLLETLKDV